MSQMLTVAYCRVSTVEQAEEGYSIEGQTDKLKAYAALRDLGEVLVVADPGVSGGTLKRAGLQQILAAVDAGHVSHVLVWRLDRLSRNLGDLIMLADRFGEKGVALHSVSENLDLSSAAGRMFYNILGTFAQYSREQLSENVKMGTERAIKEGKWTNRAKTGYSVVGGELVANSDAVRVREVFRLRAKNLSYRAIEERTGFKYSTVCSILNSRVYLGEIPHNGQWYAGKHEPLVTEEEWRAAHRGLKKGVQPSGDLLTGRVRCGLCGRRMVIQQNGKRSLTYGCWHRGQGCHLPSRSNKGLARGAVLGMKLWGTDERLIEAVRRQSAGESRAERRDRRPTAATALESLTDNRNKLLALYYEGNISGEGFREAEQQLLSSIETARDQVAEEQGEVARRNDLEERFEHVAAILRELDIDAIWQAAEEEERRVLIQELIEWVTVFPDHLEVQIAGAPPLNVLMSEVGLKVPEIVGVGGPK